MTFIRQNMSDKLTVDHVDRNRDNNHVSNLRCATTEQQALNQSSRENKGSRHPVYQYHLDGTLICRWDKSGEIESNNISSVSHVFSVCKGKRRTAGGYTWKYADMEDLPGEEWRLIPYEELGSIFSSNKGRIKRINGKITTGYLSFALFRVQNSNMTPLTR